MTKNYGWEPVAKRKQRLYSVWVSMRTRCHNPNSPAYKWYGAIGITMCPEWENYESFREWAKQSGYDPYAPRGKCTIDRINSFGNYEPSNCRWATVTEQNRNQRDAKVADWEGIRNEYIKTKIGTEKLAIKYGVSKRTLAKRAWRERWMEARIRHESEADHAE